MDAIEYRRLLHSRLAALNDETYAALRFAQKNGPPDAPIIARLRAMAAETDRFVDEAAPDVAMGVAV